MYKGKQKKLAVINDFSGFGRCSLTVSLPIVSSFGIQCCCLPTAIFSNHTAYESYFFDDYTDKMQEFTKNWELLELGFDGIYSGFLGSAKQVDIVINFISRFKGENTRLIVDPVMGDNGVLYSTCTDEMRKELKKLAALADIVTPNLTELCFLTDTPYSRDLSRDQIIKMAAQLCGNGSKNVVVTGISKDNVISNLIYSGEGYCFVSSLKQGIERAGTGDVFSSVVAAAVVNGETLRDAVLKAVRLIEKAGRISDELEIPPENGICFEKLIKLDLY
ncbi:MULTISPECIES: pyridoxamine kinase [unclassified Ruminococcus]|uniref:pyridoxamine kinase n=1 Tax=unclassified Ruminococcus TaxID=2608920 RepID=UPI002108A5E7|nr:MULTISPECIES: pyridoxamine kinase [unclassified Ruminococcus]MCQ4022033.1 pyridoxamine kinase [Ruminococcus sp. zg-924]MCQ4114569.1 pyridoxamine kinase [Ruminococcus sp. zg-921]